MIRSILPIIVPGLLLAACAGGSSRQVVNSPNPPRIERVATADLARVAADQFAALPPLEDGIRRFRQRVQNEPDQLANYLTLADLYVRRAEMGEPSGYGAAELVLEDALNRDADYTPARLKLAAVFNAQGLYKEGLGEAQQVLLSTPDSDEAMSLVADSHLALGRISAAETAYRRVREQTPELLARLSRLEWYLGNPEEALELAEQAAGDALWHPQERYTMAGHLVRVGELAFESAELELAEDYLDSAVRVDPNARTLAALGEVRLAQERYRDAASLLERSVDRNETPGALMLLVDAYEELGDEARAAEIRRRVPNAARAPMAPTEDRVRPRYYEDLALYYADYTTNYSEALAMAQSNLEFRQDAYAQDALAWALFRNGEYDSAAEAINKAMQAGVQDARIYYHAGMILRSLGYTAEGDNFLSKALRLNPWFSLKGAREIRQAMRDQLP